MKFIPLILYALILIIGGTFGFVKAHSLISLIMGASFGAGLLVLIYGIYTNCSYSLWLTLALTLLLTVFFGFRFIKTGSFFPSGMMASLSLLASFYTLWMSRK